MGFAELSVGAGHIRRQHRQLDQRSFALLAGGRVVVVVVDVCENVVMVVDVFEDVVVFVDLKT